MSALYPANPANMPVKSKVIDTYAAEAVAAGSFYGDAVEVPRGADNIAFIQEATLLDGTTGDEDYQFFIQGRASPDHEWVTLPGLTFTAITNASGDTSAIEQLPTAANAPGTRVPRYVRAKLTSAGTSPIATAVIRMIYSSPRGPGKVVDHGIIS